MRWTLGMMRGWLLLALGSGCTGPVAGPAAGQHVLETARCEAVWSDGRRDAYDVIGLLDVDDPWIRAEAECDFEIYFNAIGDRACAQLISEVDEAGFSAQLTELFTPVAILDRSPSWLTEPRIVIDYPVLGSSSLFTYLPTGRIDIVLSMSGADSRDGTSVDATCTFGGFVED